MASIVAPIVRLIDSIITPTLILVAALGAVYIVWLGIKVLCASKPEDQKKAKARERNAVFGYVSIFVLMFALRVATPQLVDWVNENSDSITSEDLELDQATQESGNAKESVESENK